MFYMRSHGDDAHRKQLLTHVKDPGCHHNCVDITESPHHRIMTSSHFVMMSYRRQPILDQLQCEEKVRLQQLFTGSWPHPPTCADSDPARSQSPHTTQAPYTDRDERARYQSAAHPLVLIVYICRSFQRFVWSVADKQIIRYDSLIWKRFKRSSCKRVFCRAHTLRVQEEVKVQPTGDSKTLILLGKIKIKMLSCSQSSGLICVSLCRLILC